jgi:hypothetical protein
MNADKHGSLRKNEKTKSRQIDRQPLGPKRLFSQPANAQNPPSPPFLKGGCEKIEWRQVKASFVARGWGKFTAPKPGGRCMAGKNSPDFRKATPATCENFYKYERMTVSASVV